MTARCARRAAPTSGSARTSVTGSRTCSGRSTGSPQPTASRSSAVSPVYETAPVGGPEQPDYLNAVVAVDTDARRPARCSSSRSALEARRPSGSAPSAGARGRSTSTCCSSATSGSTSPTSWCPHPRMTERAFVLVPLADLDPGWRARIPRRRRSRSARPVYDWRRPSRPAPAPGPERRGKETQRCTCRVDRNGRSPSWVPAAPGPPSPPRSSARGWTRGRGRRPHARRAVDPAPRPTRLGAPARRRSPTPAATPTS